MTNSELKERLVDTLALLNIPGVGRGRFKRLVERFGSPAEVFSVSMAELEAVSNLSRTTALAILNNYDGEKARQVAAKIVQLGWSVLFPDDADYPRSLQLIDTAPPVLFRMGEAATSDDKAIAIVGTRHATESGRRFTHKLAADLAREGVIVESGMAEGIDSAAHRGALDAGGKTVAVWGTPLNRVYPPSNRELAERIIRQGAVYSEYLPGTELNPAYFPERNRIISGMSEGVVVVEAGERSGALITARCALEQGRELFAVPGSLTAKEHIGTNLLIKRGATLLTGVGDIFEELPRLKGHISAKKFKQLPDLTDMERRMVSLLSSGPLQIDQLCRTTELTVSELMEFLLALELKGVVQELSGKRYILTE